MKKATPLILNILALALLLGGFFLVVQNLSVPVPLNLGTVTRPDVPLGLVILLGGLLFGLAAVVKGWERVLSLGQQHRKTNRELERREVSREEAEEKVKVLENKIQTLEKALDAALKSRT